MSAKETITALRTTLQAGTDLTYASDSGYEDADVEELVQLNKFPFFNITCEGWETAPAPNMNIKHLERTIYDMLIQFATRAMKKTLAKQGDSGRPGIYDFADDIWDTIRADPTLGRVINGYLPGSSVLVDVVEVQGNNERYFIGAGEMKIKLYKDIGRA